MAKYKILVIELLLSNNKVARRDDIVDESALTRPAAELVEHKFIEPVEEAEPVEEVKDEQYERSANIYKVMYENEAPAGYTLEELNQGIVNLLHTMYVENVGFQKDIFDNADTVSHDEVKEEAPAATPEPPTEPLKPTEQVEDAPAVTEDAPAESAEVYTEANADEFPETPVEAPAAPVATLNVGKSKKTTGN